MAGIYIHIPFCRAKCNYCNFFSLATTRFRDEFFEALLKEIELTSGYLCGEPIETIYFGGGTPSLLPVADIERIIDKIRRMKDEGCGTNGHCEKRSDEAKQEITLEINPDDFTSEYLEALTESPVNRLSIGIQSFFDEDLKYLGRLHSARHSKQTSKIENRQSKIENFSVDLIYGIPTLTNDHWKENLNRVVDLGIPHLSAYALTVEPKTILAWQIEKGKGAGHRAQGTGHRAQGAGHRTQGTGHRAQGAESSIRHPVSDDQTAVQLDILMDIMEQNGYIQYEISNFCLPGYESRHNSNYWKGIPYLGLGPSAHSYNGISRRWNVSQLRKYIEGIESGNPVTGEEVLTPDQRYNEYVMISLRTVWGSDLSAIGNRFGETYAVHFSNLASHFINSGHLREDHGIYTLTRQGKFLADRIGAELFSA